MSYIRITKEFRLEMAHALLGYDGPCRNIHGHSYILYVTLIGEPINDSLLSNDGMVMDFNHLKKIIKTSIVDEFDHALVLNSAIPEEQIKTLELLNNLVLVPYQPTCENLLIDFASRIMKLLSHNIKLFSLKLCETSTSYAEWYASDNHD